MNRKEATAGRAITRREALALLGSGAAWLAGTRCAQGAPAGAALPACIARPQQTEGPFFVENALERSDIRPDPLTGVSVPGAPLRLAFRVSRVTGSACAPLAGAQVDVWHCDAAGRYSEVGGRSQSPRGSFLRGYQRTNAAGSAQFLTIYPGWYGGRAVHVHFKIRTQAASGRGQEFTSQLYFDEALSDRVFALAPYATHGRPSMRNADDFIFRDGGRALLLDTTQDGDGYAATFDIGLVL
jgi:protocatechuate 3,4-dioxygenase beta subunit